jgi:ribonuclease P protein component
MVVAKKNTAKAASRNRLKRLIREVFRRVSPASLDIVILTRSGTNGKSTQALNQILVGAFATVVEKSSQQTVLET